MTGREYETALVSHAAGDHVKLVFFADIGLDSGTQRVHTGVGELEFNSNIYYGLGDFAGISAIRDGSEITTYPVELTLSGIGAALKQSSIDFLDAINTEDFYGRDVTVYVGALDTDSDDLVSTPNECYSGQMQSPRARLGSENAISVPVENEFALFEKVNGARYSDADLQEEFTGDLGFQYLSQMVDQRVVWRGSHGTFGLPPGDPNTDPFTAPAFDPNTLTQTPGGPGYDFNNAP